MMSMSIYVITICIQHSAMPLNVWCNASAWCWMLIRWEWAFKVPHTVSTLHPTVHPTASILRRTSSERLWLIHPVLCPPSYCRGPQRSCRPSMDISQRKRYMRPHSDCWWWDTTIHSKYTNIKHFEYRTSWLDLTCVVSSAGEHRIASIRGNLCDHKK